MKHCTFFLVMLYAVVSTAGGKPSGKGPCSSGAQCAGGVCVEVNNEAYCSSTCGACGAGMYCDSQLFAVAGLKVCVKGGVEKPVQPKEPPRIPCVSDRECKNGLVCAQFMGERDCTRVCNAKSDCEAPAMMGVKMDFLGCAADESGVVRNVCLPRKECVSNPMSCMSVNGGAMMGMVGSMEAMGNSFGGAEETQAQAAPAPAPAPAKVSVVTQQPAKEAEPARKGPPMTASAFAQLLKQVKNGSFSSDQLNAVKLAAKRNFFTCQQIKELLGVFTFSNDKLKTLEVLVPRAVDLQNSHVVLDAFEYAHDRDKAAKMLGAGDEEDDVVEGEVLEPQED